LLHIGNPYQGKRQTLSRVKCWNTIFQANTPKKKAGVAILISNKINFQPKVIKKRRRGTSYTSKVKCSKRNSLF
jgi:hypothetical protein